MEVLQTELVSNIRKINLNKSISNPVAVVDFIKNEFLKVTEPINKEFASLIDIHDSGKSSYLSIDNFELILIKESNAVHVGKSFEDGTLVFSRIFFKNGYTFVSTMDKEYFFDDKQLENIFREAFENILKLDVKL